MIGAACIHVQDWWICTSHHIGQFNPKPPSNLSMISQLLAQKYAYRHRYQRMPEALGSVSPTICAVEIRERRHRFASMEKTSLRLLATGLGLP
jgi:hypothetical protein